VLSSRIADAEITYIGAGQVGDSVNQGWLSRGLRAISPF
jgi:flagellar L-ring protein precursor FlgH